MIATYDALRMAADLLDPPPDPYFDRPDLWVSEFITFPEGEFPTPYQLETLRHIPIDNKVSARGPHGLGKTAMEAWAVLWFALTRERRGADWKIPCTASAWRQLEKFLWPEIHKWARRIRWDKLGWRGPFNERSELLTLQLRLKFGAAFALASDTPSAIEGVHADQVLYIYDEAKAIPAAIFDATEGAFSAAGTDTNKIAYAFACSTPGSPAGRFYEIHKRLPGYRDWWVRHVTLAEAIANKRISAAWVELRKIQWGELSSVYQNRVLGEFATQDEDAIIPLAWVELAVDRWDAAMVVIPAFTCLGVDVARYGTDRSCIAHRHANVITEIEDWGQLATTELTGYVISTLRGKAESGYAVVDVVGVGGGVVDQLREREYETYAFNAGASSDLADISGELRFTNVRAAAWWGFRELLDPVNQGTIALPNNDGLVGDLTAPKWRMTSGGSITIESKDDIRKRIGRSTDFADAVVQAFWTPDEASEEQVEYTERVAISPY